MRKVLATLAMVATLAGCASCDGGTVVTSTSLGGYDTVMVYTWGYNPMSGNVEHHFKPQQQWNPNKVVVSERCMR